MKKELQTAIPSTEPRDRATADYRVRPLARADFPVLGQRLEELLAPDAMIDLERMNADLGRSIEPSAECAYWIIEHDHDAVALAFGPRRPNAAGDLEAIVWLIGKPAIDSGLIQASKSVQRILHWGPSDFCRAKGWLVSRTTANGGTALSRTKICALKAEVS